MTSHIIHILDIIPFGMELAFRAGMLASVTRHHGISLGDRACLALALQNEASAITCDKVWQDLDIGVEIKIIR